jgi:nucleoid DNA-binding protein
MAKKKTAKKKTKKGRAKATTETKPRTKSQIYGSIADDTGLTRKEVASVFESMGTYIRKDLGRRGPGTFNVGGFMKIKTKKVAAKPRRKGINPFTGEEQWFKAKPASTRVKITALKALKDMV